MKKIIYITKNKVWIGSSAFPWKEDELIDIFKTNSEKINSNDLRIVLGNDVSYLCSFPASEVEILSREEIQIKTQSFFPVEIGNENFDWKMVKIGEDAWVQSVAVEMTFLNLLSKAIKLNKIKVGILIPVGILMGEKSILEKSPVLVKWSGQEKLKVLAVRGLVDSVFSEVEDQEILDLAKVKWSLKAEPKVLLLDDKNFKIDDEVYNEKNKGSDADILSLQLIKDVDLDVRTQSATTGPVAGEVAVVEDNKVSAKKWSKILLVILLITLIGGVGWFSLSYQRSKPNSANEKASDKTVSAPATTPTPTTVVLDFSKYSIQVLNGSGVTGVAAGIKDTLLAEGFVIVDTGNAEATISGFLQAKTSIPATVKDKAKESISGYVINETETLTKDNKYDLVIVVGTEKR